MSEMNPNTQPLHQAPSTANPDIASLYLATVVTVDDHGTWRPAHEVAAKLGTLHVLTAWNPGDERPARAVRDARSISSHGEVTSGALRLLQAEARKGCALIPLQ